MPKKLGRPSLTKINRRATLIRVLTTEAEHAEIKQAATWAGMSVSTWIRSIALEKARVNSLL